MISKRYCNLPMILSSHVDLLCTENIHIYATISSTVISLLYIKCMSAEKRQKTQKKSPVLLRNTAILIDMKHHLNVDY